MIVRSPENVKGIIKQFIKTSGMSTLQQGLLLSGLAQVPTDSPLLQIGAEVLDALNRQAYAEAKYILHKAVDAFIDSIAHESADHQTE